MKRMNGHHRPTTVVVYQSLKTSWRHTPPLTFLATWWPGERRIVVAS